MKQNILIADDEERMRTLMCAYLKNEGYEIFQAKDGEEALEIFSKNKIHLLLLDIMMPKIDGWKVCSEIRKVSDVPIIMLTAKSQEEDKLLGFGLGTDNYVTKPFSPRILVANVKALLKRAYSHHGNGKTGMINCGVLEINTSSHKVTVSEDEVFLTHKEYELLLYMISNKGQALSREMILDAVWGYDYYGDLRTVDTHIKRLREKLMDKAYLIATVRGSGYKLEVKR